MSRLLIASIDRFGPVGNEVRDSLSECSQTVLHVPAGQTIVALEAPSRFRLLARGLAVRQHVLADGGRQILGFVTPGDLMDLAGLFAGADHEVRALSDCEVRQTSVHEARALVRGHPNLLAALCRVVMTEARLHRNWMVGLGRRTAVARMANLFCEIYARQKVVALAQDGHCQFPALQADLADALGLSVVHTHRILRTLKADGLAALRGGQLTILDWDGLAALAEFDPACFRPQADAVLAAAARASAEPPPQAMARA